MAEQMTLTVQTREAGGTSPARRLRRQGWVPCIVYGSDRQAQKLQVRGHEFETMLRRHTSENLILTLQIEGQSPCTVLLREVQHDAVTGRILHADFYKVSMTRKLRIQIPVELKGEPVGVSQQGGVLEHLLRSVEVECLPGDVVEGFTLDVSGLSIGQSLTVRDLTIDAAKFNVLTDPAIAVAAVAAPRVIEEEVPAEEAAAAEPELIGAKKEEEAAEGAEKEPEKGKEKEPAKGKEKEPAKDKEKKKKEEAG